MKKKHNALSLAQVITKAMTGTILIALFISGITITYSIYDEQNKVRQEAQKSIEKLSELVAYSLWTIDEEELYVTLADFLDEPNIKSIDIYEVENDRKILLKSVENQVANTSSDFIVSNSVFYKKRTVGYIEMTISGLVFKSIYKGIVFSTTFMTVSLLFGLFIFYRYTISSTIKNKVSTINDGLEKLRQGNYLYRFKDAYESDINAIHQNINKMAEAIHQRERDLENHMLMVSDLSSMSYKLYEKSSVIDVIKAGVFMGCSISKPREPLLGQLMPSSYPFTTAVGSFFDGIYSLAADPYSYEIDITSDSKVLGSCTFYSDNEFNSSIKTFLKSMRSVISHALDQHIVTKEQIELQISLESQKSLSDTIQRTSQMLAHDVRKPLTLVQMLMEATESITEPKKVTATLKRFEKEIETALEHADGLIEDVLALEGR